MLVLVLLTLLFINELNANSLYCYNWNNGGCTIQKEDSSSSDKEVSDCFGIVITEDTDSNLITMTFDKDKANGGTCNNLYINPSDLKVKAVFNDITGISLFKYAEFQYLSAGNTLIIDTSNTVVEDNSYLKFRGNEGEIEFIKGTQTNIFTQIVGGTGKFNIKEGKEGLSGIFQGSIDQDGVGYNIIGYTPVKCPTTVGGKYDFANVPTTNLQQSIYGKKYTFTEGEIENNCYVNSRVEGDNTIFYLSQNEPPKIQFRCVVKNDNSCIIEKDIDTITEGTKADDCWGIGIKEETDSDIITMTFDKIKANVGDCQNLYIKPSDFKVKAVFNDITGISLFKYAQFENLPSDNKLIIDTSNTVIGNDENIYLKFRGNEGEIEYIKGTQTNIFTQIVGGTGKFIIKEGKEGLNEIFQGSIDQDGFGYIINEYTPVKCPTDDTIYEFAKIPTTGLKQKIIGKKYTFTEGEIKNNCYVNSRVDGIYTIFYLQTTELIADPNKLYCFEWDGGSCTIQKIADYLNQYNGLYSDDCFGIEITEDTDSSLITMTFDKDKAKVGTCQNLFIKPSDLKVKAVFNDITGINLFKYAEFQSLPSDNKLIIDTSNTVIGNDENIYLKFRGNEGEIEFIKGTQTNTFTQIVGGTGKFNIKEGKEGLSGIFQGSIDQDGVGYNIIGYTPLKCPTTVGGKYDFANVPTTNLQQSIVEANYTFTEDVNKITCTVNSKVEGDNTIFYLETTEITTNGDNNDDTSNGDNNDDTSKDDNNDDTSKDDNNDDTSKDDNNNDDTSKDDNNNDDTSNGDNNKPDNNSNNSSKDEKVSSSNKILMILTLLIIVLCF